MPWFLIQVRTMKKLSEIIWWKISSSFLHKTDAFYMYMNCHVCHMKVLFSILKICYHQNRNYCYNHGHNLWNFLILYQIFFSPVKRSLIISNNHGIYELPHELRYFTWKLEFVSYILSMIAYRKIWHLTLPLYDIIGHFSQKGCIIIGEKQGI